MVFFIPSTKSPSIRNNKHAVKQSLVSSVNRITQEEESEPIFGTDLLKRYK